MCVCDFSTSEQRSAVKTGLTLARHRKPAAEEPCDLDVSFRQGEGFFLKRTRKVKVTQESVTGAFKQCISWAQSDQARKVSKGKVIADIVGKDASYRLACFGCGMICVVLDDNDQSLPSP